MKEENDYEKDLASIRRIMERSVKFLSISGLSGVLAGTYALIGSMLAYLVLYYPGSLINPRFEGLDEKSAVTKLASIAATVLLLSLVSGCLMSLRKAKKIGMPIWNATSKQLLIDLLVPLASGGLLILILLTQGNYGVIAPACLIFYGLALIQGGRSTFVEIKYLGLTEIVLGLASALFPSFGLIFWALGFGVMHMVYGAVMYFRYER